MSEDILECVSLEQLLLNNEYTGGATHSENIEFNSDQSAAAPTMVNVKRRGAGKHAGPLMTKKLRLNADRSRSQSKPLEAISCDQRQAGNQG